MALDQARLPLVLPSNVPRTQSDGRPTKETIDNEFATRQWYLQNAIVGDRRLTTVELDLNDTTFGIKGKIQRLDEVVGDEATGLIKAVSSVTGEVSTARGPYGSLIARFSNTETIIGDASSGLVKSTNEIKNEIQTARGGFGDLSGKIGSITDVVGNASTGLVKATNDVTTEVSAARGAFGTLSARVQHTDTVVGDASSGLVKSTSELRAEVETARNGKTSLVERLELTDSTLEGVSLRYTVLATIDGATGGYKLVGVQRADGTGPVFTLIIDANVEINGNLLVNGTVDWAQLAAHAVTRAATTTAVSSTGVGISISVRAGANVLVIATISNTSGTIAVAGNGTVYVNKYFGIFVTPPGGVANIVANVETTKVYAGHQFLGGSAYQFLSVVAPATGVYQIENTSAGVYNIQLLNPEGVDITMSVTAIELAK